MKAEAPLWTATLAAAAMCAFAANSLLCRLALGAGLIDAATFTTVRLVSGALLLAALGIYGILSHSIATRLQEISIRMALGATARRVVTSVLIEALAVTAVGLVLGMAATFFAREALTGLLFGVTPLDRRAIAAAALTLLVAAAVASYLPARRASRIDPAKELR